MTKSFGMRLALVGMFGAGTLAFLSHAPLKASAASSTRGGLALNLRAVAASKIDLYQVYMFRESRTNITGSDIRAIACRTSLRRGDPGWRIIETALNHARLIPDPDRRIGAVDLRLGLVLSNDSGELASLYFMDNYTDQPRLLRGELDRASVFVPTSIEVAIHQIMGRLRRDCGPYG